MGNKNLQSKNSGEVSPQTEGGELDSLNRRGDIEFIQDQFGVKGAVEQLHTMMGEVTKDEFNAKNVNAACHCIQQLNQTIDTTIKAARFLRGN